MRHALALAKRAASISGARAAAGLVVSHSSCSDNGDLRQDWLRHRPIASPERTPAEHHVAPAPSTRPGRAVETTIARFEQPRRCTRVQTVGDVKLCNVLSLPAASSVKIVPASRASRFMSCRNSLRPSLNPGLKPVRLSPKL